MKAASLCRVAGVDRDTIRGFLGGRVHTPGHDKMRLLAQAMGISVDLLIDPNPAARAPWEMDFAQAESMLAGGLSSARMPVSGQPPPGDMDARSLYGALYDAFAAVHAEEGKTMSGRELAEMTFAEISSVLDAGTSDAERLAAVRALASRERRRLRDERAKSLRQKNAGAA